MLNPKRHSLFSIIPIPLAGATAIVGIAFLAIFQIQPLDTHEFASINGFEGDPDYAKALEPSSSATGVTWQVFSDTGGLVYEVNALSLEQYHWQNLTRVFEPAIRLTRERATPWLITSEQGNITQSAGVDSVPADGEELELLGNVQVSTNDGSAERALDFSTIRLSVYPNQQRAITTAQVELRHRRFITRSIGFELDLQTGSVIFAKNTNQRVFTTLFLKDVSGASKIDK